jgi:hypothetical protein
MPQRLRAFDRRCAQNLEKVKVKLIMALGALVVIAVCVFAWLRATKPSPRATRVPRKDGGIGEIRLPAKDERPRKLDPDVPVKPFSFGYKCAWLAIKDASPESVIAALSLTAVRTCNWQRGVAAAYELGGDVFVTQPIQGYVLVAGLSLPDGGDSRHPDRLTPFLIQLSKHLPEIQYFGTHRVVDYHAWALVRDSQVVRAYAYVGDLGETIWNRGEPTPAEKELDFHFFDGESEEAKKPGYYGRNDLRFPCEEDVMKVAAKWSVDPTQLDQLDLQPSTGWLGRLPEGTR